MLYQLSYLAEGGVILVRARCYGQPATGFAATAAMHPHRGGSIRRIAVSLPRSTSSTTGSVGLLLRNAS